jgi:hypothetical protein
MAVSVANSLVYKTIAEEEKLSAAQGFIEMSPLARIGGAQLTMMPIAVSFGIRRGRRSVKIAKPNLGEDSNQT